MDDATKKAFDFANELTKQLITLSTAIIAFSATFFDKVTNSSFKNIDILFWSWGLFLASIIFGIFTISALTAALAPKGSEDTVPSIRKRPVAFASMLQNGTFLSAMLLFVLYIIRSMPETP